MPQSPRVLSTDPNAGEPLRSAPRVLSTDPEAGEALRIARRFADSPSVMSDNRMVDALPSVGGLAGSLIGGSKSNPFGMLLAATGGAGGEAYRQALSAINGDWEKVPPDVQSQMSAILAEGVKQGGLEGAGRYVLGPIMKLFGRAIYRSGLKPSVDVRREFGGADVTNTLVEAGVPITRTGRGTEKVEALLGTAGRETRDLVAAAEASGTRGGTMRPVLRSLNRTRGNVTERALRQEPLEEIQGFRDAVLRENPGQQSVSRLQSMKQAEQELATKAYQAEARGIPVNNLEVALHEDLARGLREAIERRIPSIANKNARTQDLIGALKAITAAEGRIANNNLIGMGDLLALGSGVGAATATGRPSMMAVGVLQEVLTRPEIASRLGIVMDRAGRPQITPQILRTISEAVNQVQP